MNAEGYSPVASGGEPVTGFASLNRPEKSGHMKAVITAGRYL